MNRAAASLVPCAISLWYQNKPLITHFLFSMIATRATTLWLKTTDFFQCSCSVWDVLSSQHFECGSNYYSWSCDIRYKKSLSRRQFSGEDLYGSLDTGMMLTLWDSLQAVIYPHSQASVWKQDYLLCRIDITAKKILLWTHYIIWGL